MNKGWLDDDDGQKIGNERATQKQTKKRYTKWANFNAVNAIATDTGKKKCDTEKIKKTSMFLRNQIKWVNHAYLCHIQSV